MYWHTTHFMLLNCQDNGYGNSQMFLAVQRRKQGPVLLGKH